MDLTTLSLKDLNAAAKLLTQRQKLEVKQAGLQSQIDAINQKLSSFTSVQSPVSTKGASAPAQRGRKPGKFTVKMLSILTVAGSKGTPPKEMATKTGRNAAQVNNWLNTTGKKQGVVKLGRGLYALKGQAAAPVVKTAKPAKRKMSAETKAKLAASATARWAKVHAAKAAKAEKAVKAAKPVKAEETKAKK